MDKHTKGTRAAAIAALKRGEPRNATADSLGIGRATLTAWAKEEGLALPRGRRAATRVRPSAEFRLIVAMLHNAISTRGKLDHQKWVKYALSETKRRVFDCAETAFVDIRSDLFRFVEQKRVTDPKYPKPMSAKVRAALTRDEDACALFWRVLGWGAFVRIGHTMRPLHWMGVVEMLVVFERRVGREDSRTPASVAKRWREQVEYRLSQMQDTAATSEERKCAADLLLLVGARDPRKLPKVRRFA